MNLDYLMEDSEPSLTLYHGTMKDFKKLSLTKSWSTSLGRGFYCTDSLELAKNYGKHVIKLEVRAKFFEMNWRTESGREKSKQDCKILGLDVNVPNWIEGKDRINQVLIKNGYDGVKVLQPKTDNIPEHVEYCIFKEKCILSQTRVE